MELSKQAILYKTHYGLNIYAHVLQEYYPGETVLSLSGRNCQPAKNPFNNDKATLQIVCENSVFRFRDDELEDFGGDPFDFAEMHYQLQDEALFHCLNTQMNLGLSMPQSIEPEIEIPSFSLFLHPVSNVNPYQTINLWEAWSLIRSPYYKEQTTQLREINEPKEARKFKASQFDYATFSGVFTKRSDDALKRHSGLLTIDFDHVPHIGELKILLSQDNYFETELMFVSPSGDGVKWIISIDLNECTHQEWFRAIENYIKATYGLDIDKSGKDISRACFLPYDPDVYLNPKYRKQEVLTPNSESHETR
jgi:hypothetical protein